jgi:hypothetical protein
MKLIINILFLCLSVFTSFAQQDDLPQTPDPGVREKIEAARVAYITDKLQLTPSEAEKFWPVYREFVHTRREIRWKLRRLSRSDSLQKNDKEIIEQQLKIKQEEVDLERDYSGRLLKVISAQKLRSLPQVEREFRRMILEQIQRRRIDRQEQIHEKN